MKALSIHAPYVYEILTGLKKEEYRTWKTKETGRILICSSAKKYKGYASGYAFCTAKIGEIKEYPYYDDCGKRCIEYGWKLSQVKFVKPFPLKGKLHLFDTDDDLIKVIPDITVQEFIEKYYDPLRSW